MSFQIGNLDLGVSFVGDASGLTRAMGQAGGEVERFGRRARTELGGVGAEARRTDDAMSRLATGIKGAFVGGSVAVGLIVLKNHVVSMGSAIIDAQVQLDKLNNSMRFAAGDRAASQIEYMRSEVGRLGLDLSVTAGQFAKFSASTLSVGVPADKANKIFSGLAQTMTVLGLNSEQVDRAFNAVVQSFSKGQVMAEEIRGQFGEHVPGAFEMAAQAMGVTAAQLNKDMENGLIKPLEFWTKYSDYLFKKTEDDWEHAAKSMQSSLNRLSTAWLTFKQEIAQSGVGEAISNDINAAAGLLSVVSRAMEQARKDGAGMWETMANGAGAALGVAAFGSVEWAAETLNGAIKLATGGVVDFGTELNLMPENLRTTAEQTASLAGKIDAAKQQMNVLEVLFGSQPESPYLRIKLAETRALVLELERAKMATEELDGKGENYGNETRREDARIGDMKRLEEQAKAVQAFWQKNMTPVQKMNAELATMKASLGALFTPDIEAQIRKNYKTATAGAKGLTDAQKELAEAAKTEAKIQEIIAKKEQDWVYEAIDAKEKLIEAASELYEADLKTYTASAESAQKSLQDLTDQADAVAYAEAHQISLAQAVEYTTIARLREQQILERHTPAVVAALQAEIDARQKIIGVLGSNETRDAARELRKNEQAEWARTWEQVSQSFTDALMQGGQSVKDYLKNLFRTLVLRPILAPVGGAMASLFGGSAMAGQGGGGSIMGTINSLSSVMGNLATSSANFLSGATLNAQAAGAWTRAGDWMATSSNNAISSAGDWMQANPGMGSAMGMAGNAMAGYGLQKTISGGYKTGESGLVDAITVAASAYFGPIAGVVAGVFNRAFGRKLKDSGFQGEFGGEQGFQGQNFEFHKGGWFRSDKTKTSAMDGDLQTALATQYASLKGASTAMANTLGQNASALDTYTRSIKLSTKGLTEEQITQKINDEFAALGNEMATLVLGTAEFTRSGETASQTLARLSSSLATVNQISDMLGWTLQATSAAGGSAASTFADLFGGLDKMAAATSSYYDAFYTESERTATATRQLTETLAALGVALPASRDAYRDLIDNALASGNQKLAADLVMLSGAFAALSKSADDLAAAASAAAEEAIRAAKSRSADLAADIKRLYDAFDKDALDIQLRLLDLAGQSQDALNLRREAEAEAIDETLRPLYRRVQALEAEKDALSSVNGAYAEATRKIDGFADGITAFVTQLLAQQSSVAASQSYAQQLRLAASGDPAAMTGITSAADAFLAIEKARATSSSEYAFSASKVASDLSRLPSQIRPEVLIAQAIKDSAARQLNATEQARVEQAAALQALIASTGRAVNFEQFAAYTGQSNEILRSIFTGADLNADGLIDAVEASKSSQLGALQALIASTGKAVNFEQFAAYSKTSNSELLRIFQAIDSNGDGTISALEAVNASTVVVGSSTQGLESEAQKQLTYLAALTDSTKTNVSTMISLNSTMLTLKDAIYELGVSQAEQARLETQRLLSDYQAQGQALVASRESDPLLQQAIKTMAISSFFLSEPFAQNPIPGTSIYNIVENTKAEKAAAELSFANRVIELSEPIEVLRGQIRALGAVPAFALGGTHLGGLRLVGENGPELEATGPARIYNASQTRAMLSGGRDDRALVAELQALRSEVQALRAEARATAVNTGRTQDLMKRVTRNGEAMQMETAT